VPRKRDLAPVILVLALTLGGCVPQTAPTSAPKAAGQPQPATAAPAISGPLPAAPTATAGAAPAAKKGNPVPPKVGDVAFDFTLRNLQGKAVSLSDYRGKKVMLNFWATWCGPCRVELPGMIKLYDELSGKGFVILAVNLREDHDQVAGFVEQNKMRFPVLLDSEGSVGTAYFVRGIPTTVFINDQGIIQAVQMGTLTDAAMRQYVAKLME
jgi:peroxiredoxin